MFKASNGKTFGAFLFAVVPRGKVAVPQRKSSSAAERV